MTWHEKKNDDRRGDHVEEERLLDSWVYAGGRPVICSRYQSRGDPQAFNAYLVFMCGKFAHELGTVGELIQ